MSEKTVLIIDDERDIRNLIAGILEDEGYIPLQAGTSDEAYAMIDSHAPDALILDIWLEGSADDGMGILHKTRKDNPLLPVIMISGHGTIETAVNALKEGAYDFIEKPFKTDRLLVMVRRALEASALERENRKLKAHNAPAHLQFVGQSSTYKAFEDVLLRVAKTNSRVVLTGEAGTGKTAAGRFIHDNSDRVNGPFVVLNCATLNPDRFEVELFGAEKGIAGPYAMEGLLQEAHGGTLLLDEVADMPPATQAKILKVLQESRFQRVGGQDFTDIDVRFIATTHKDLKAEIEEGHFREDLYYRLNVVPVEVPPLRECSDDLEAFIALFSGQVATQSGLPVRAFSKAALEVMRGYKWPGNMRQLRNVIEWVMIMKPGGGAADVQDLPPDLSSAAASASPRATEGAHETGLSGFDGLTAYPLKEARAEFERHYISAQLDKFEGNISKTADFIGMERSALHRKIKQLQLNVTGGNLQLVKTDKQVAQKG